MNFSNSISEIYSLCNDIVRFSRDGDLTPQRMELYCRRISDSCDVVIGCFRNAEKAIYEGGYDTLTDEAVITIILAKWNDKKTWKPHFRVADISNIKIKSANRLKTKS